MASSLTDTTLTVNGTQSITGVSDSVLNSNSHVSTSGGIFNAFAASGKKQVGGIIFYINPSSTNTYRFYNGSTQISEPTVGSDYTNYFYEKIGNDVDKYYVYYPDTNTSNVYYFISGYRYLMPSTFGSFIGAGKANTSLLMITMVNKDFGDSTYNNRKIWNALKDMRVNKTNGCDDWYIGCRAEYDELRNSGTPGASWNSYWSSEAYSGINTSFYVKNNSSSSGWTNYSYGSSSGFVPIRSF